MRFMVLLVEADKDSEAGVHTDQKFVAEMRKYNEELVKAGVILAGERLHPSSKGARVKFSGEKRTVIDGPFTEAKELIAGFWLWQVKSKEEAIEWIRRSPFREDEVEIRQVFEAEDFGRELTPEEASMQITIASSKQPTVKGASTITPCLWFDGQAEEAAKFYVSLFPDAHIGQVVKAPADFPSGKKGDVLVVVFTLMGQSFSGLNGGPYFKFNEAVSFTIPCEDQTEVDRYWNALSAVPEAEQCGWVKDRYGLSWQIVPTMLHQLLADPDRTKAGRVMEAMLKMKKLDIAALERAAQK